jgi:hypothetical protein
MEKKPIFFIEVQNSLRSKLLLLMLMALLSAFFVSCSSSEKVISWNVELKDSELPITNQCNPDEKLQAVKSGDKPILLPATEEREGRVKVYGIPCAKGEESPVYEIPVNRVKRITYVSDPLLPPSTVGVNDLEVFEGCCRVRDGVWIFDKLEIKGFLGYRGVEDSVVYPTAAGEEVYHSSFFGFDRGGSSMVLGLDIAALWNVPFIDKSGKFQLGLHTGLWPHDESLFIPGGLHARYTFNQVPPKYSDNCNTWFVYGNIGIPFDFQTSAPIFGNSLDYQRLYYGLGIGYDWAINCDLDFSVDLGFRYMNLPLPEITCCPTTPDDRRNPFRSSNVLLLRFGLVF